MDFKTLFHPSEIYCPAVKAPRGLMTSYYPEERGYGSNLTLSCVKGYKLVAPDDPSKICQASGTWSGSSISNFECIRITCDRPSALHNGLAIKGPRKPKYFIGD